MPSYALVNTSLKPGSASSRVDLPRTVLARKAARADGEADKGAPRIIIFDPGSSTEERFPPRSLIPAGRELCNTVNSFAAPSQYEEKFGKMIVNAMMDHGIRPEKKEEFQAPMKLSRISPETVKKGSLRWQSRLLIAAVLPFCALAVMWYCEIVWTKRIEAALILSALLALAAWRARAATAEAGVAGAILGSAISLFPSPRAARNLAALPALAAVVLLTFAATRFGRGVKERLGIAEERRGRGAAQIVANLGCAAAIASAALLIPFLAPFRAAGKLQATGLLASLNTVPESRSAVPLAVMLLAALGEAAADTMASEVGQAAGGRPVLLLTQKRVDPGVDGAISLAGTAAGAMGAIVVVLAGAFPLGLSFSSGLAAAAGSIAGLFVDSLQGATLEKNGLLNNDAVNFLSTAAAAAVSFALLHIFGQELGWNVAARAGMFSR